MQRARNNQQARDPLGLNVAGALRDGLASGVLVVNDRQRITYCSPEAEKLLRLKPSAAKQGHVTLLPTALRRIIRETASAKVALTGRSALLPARGRNPTVLRANTIPIQLRPGSRAVIIVLHDLTIAKKLDQNLGHLDRLAGLGTLSAGMAHEIKNALVSVKTFVDLLLEKNRDAELAEVVGREMRRIDAIVGQMLKYAGPARPAFSAVRVHEVLDHSLRLVQPRLESGLISLHRAFNAAPDAIQGDDYQLEQAFVNLLLNAVEAMGPNGSLTVATDLVSGDTRPKAASTSGAQVRIAIKDTGVGISTGNMGRLFEPFFTTKQQGTGLGLTITRRIVQEHNGDITVNSQENEGTTFSILLPVNASVH